MMGLPEVWDGANASHMHAGSSKSFPLRYRLSDFTTNQMLNLVLGTYAASFSLGHLAKHGCLP